MKKPRNRITAEALLNKLQSDPGWVAKREEEERIRRERVAQLRAAEAPLVAALRDVGVAVNSVWDLVNTMNPYPDAIPVLVDHLRRPYPDEIGGGIGRALAVTDACPYGRVIVDEYRATDGAAMPAKKDGLACAIAKASELGDVIQLIADPTHGDSRLLLLLALKRSQDPRAVAALRELARDPVFAKEIASWKHRRR